MKKFLIGAVVFGVAGVLACNAYAGDSFEDFKRKVMQQAQNPLGPAGDLPYGGAAPQTPEELQAMMEQEAADQQRKLLEAGWATVQQMQGTWEQQKREEEFLFAGKVVVDSKIKSVTVYNDKALVLRVAEIEVPAGSNTLVFKNLSDMVVKDSIHVEGKAGDGTKFGAITIKDTVASHAISPHEMELFKKIETLKDQLIQVDAEKTALDAKSSFLSKVAQITEQRGSENFTKGDPKPAQWADAAQTIYTGTSEALKAYAVQDQKARDIQRELTSAEQELTQIEFFQQPASGVLHGRSKSYAIMVPVVAERAGHMTVELSYQTEGATWSPLYDAKLNIDGDSSLKLVQYGVVRQQTGEDWNGVSLTLSTAQPQRGASLPDLRPKWIEGYQNTAAVPASGDQLAEWRSKTEAKRVKMEQEQLPDNREAEQPEVVPMVSPIHPQPMMRLGPVPFQPAVISTSGFVAEYVMPAASNVPSDNSQVKLKIGNFDMDSKLEVHIKPQISTNAFLVVKSKLKGDASILPGTVSLYRGDAYVGQTELPLLRPGADYDLYFGVDDQVAVSHKVLKDERKQAGIISKDNLLERGYVTELQNLHTAPVDIVVKETVPATKNEKIRVDIGLETTTPGYVADADNIKGMLDWQFKMEPKEKKDLKLGWTVSWPSDYTVTGL